MSRNLYCVLDYMAITKEELQHLQELSHITISPDQEEAFFTKLQNIIQTLDTLQKLDIENNAPHHTRTLTPRPDAKDFPDAAKLLQNVKHPIENNSIVIKSILD